MNKISKFLLFILFFSSTLVQIRAQVTATRIDVSTQNAYPFSTDTAHLTCWNGEKYVPITVKGTNLSVAVPGTYPGELAATRAQYSQWLSEIKEAGYNCVRLYTLHFPRFYEVLDSFNLAHPNNPIYLIQGVWLEEESTAYNNDLFRISSTFKQEMQEDVDCVHGKRSIAFRYGKAYGNYTVDISKWLLAYIIGREVSPDEVLTTNANYPNLTSYSGNYLFISGVKASEIFVTQKLDSLLIYEQSNYQTQRPVSFSSWPTLDPLKHPTETTTQEDIAQIDLSGTDFSKAKAGFFISYHAYPYYPDFVSRDSLYLPYYDNDGQNSYLGYLTYLKAYYKKIPLLIAEFGVPSSWGIAHYSESGMNHGGFDELNQGKVDVRLMKNILSTGCAGGVQFAWIDEWFKSTWICDPFDFPVDNRVMWQNVASAEQNFGMIGFKRGDFTYQDWETFPTGSSVKKVKAGIDYSYFNLQLPLNQSFSNLDTLWIALDTYAATLGETKLITGDTIPIGAEFLLRITNDAADLFVTEAYDLYGIWHHVSTDQQLYHSIATTGKPWKLVRWKNNSGEPEVQYIGHFQVNRLNLPPSSKDAVTFKGDTVNVRIPWTLLQFINPGRKIVMNDNRATTSVTEDTVSDGISISIKYKNQLLSTSSRYTWDTWNNFNNVVSYKKDGYATVQENLKTFDGMYVGYEDAYSVQMNNQNVVKKVDGVLCNDLLLENDSAQAVLITPPAHGFISLAANGSFVYVPDADYYGDDQFTYKATNGYQTSAATSVYLKVQENSSLIGLVKLYPNPVVNMLNIQCAGKMTEIKLYSDKGTLILTQELSSETTQLNLSSLAAGVYFAKIQVGDENVVQKFIVSK
ncbi:MAG: T9SS type A sorting domain-containing protein [Paludibacteraceae bacterium]|nr:T9SS type A sorting domain-containing protein [Paludibacteraceae bacterium]